LSARSRQRLQQIPLSERIVRPFVSAGGPIGSFRLDAQQAEFEVPLVTDDIYRSPNGDRWRLIRDPASGRRFVRHEPNVASGGRVTDTELDDFLSIDGAGPEYVNLRHLLRRQGEDD
jgi:hypothetical protein